VQRLPHRPQPARPIVLNPVPYLKLRLSSPP
jgi:hypothetical protein